MIDIGGMVVIFASIRSFTDVSIAQLRAALVSLGRLARPMVIAAEYFEDLGQSLSARWQYLYFKAQRMLAGMALYLGVFTTCCLVWKHVLVK